MAGPPLWGSGPLRRQHGQAWIFLVIIAVDRPKGRYHGIVRFLEEYVLFQADIKKSTFVGTVVHNCYLLISSVCSNLLQITFILQLILKIPADAGVKA